jgi:iron-sulfur cluster assembly accessory protein
MTDTVVASGVTLTAAAQAKVASLLAAESEDLALRVAVQPGGCAGLRYQLYFDDESLEGDWQTHFGAVKVVVDQGSAPYLAGAVIDFADTIQNQGFTIDNPNASGSCGCGGSFSAAADDFDNVDGACGCGGGPSHSNAGGTCACGRSVN